MTDESSRILKDPFSAAGFGGDITQGGTRHEKDALILDVFPNKPDEDLDMLGNCIKSIKLPGVQWGEKFDKEPVAFGVNKLRCQAIIADSKQETQVIIDTIQKLHGGDQNHNLVRSVEFVAYTRC